VGELVNVALIVVGLCVGFLDGEKVGTSIEGLFVVVGDKVVFFLLGLDEGWCVSPDEVGECVSVVVGISVGERVGVLIEGSFVGEVVMFLLGLDDGWLVTGDLDVGECELVVLDHGAFVGPVDGVKLNPKDGEVVTLSKNVGAAVEFAVCIDAKGIAAHGTIAGISIKAATTK
jgi:hypothetical protein